MNIPVPVSCPSSLSIPGDPCRNPHCDHPRGSKASGARCGYCGTCFRRWRNHGYPDGGPPEPQYQNRPRAGKQEEYLWLRAMGWARHDAAARAGVTRRTAARYERALRDGQQRQKAAA